MLNFGYIKTEFDGTEYLFEGMGTENIPDEYSYVKSLPEVMDQGNLPICAPCTMATYLNWKEGVNSGIIKDCGIKVFDIYNSKSTTGDGMTFKDAFHYLRHHGVRSDNGKLKIGTYAYMRNSEDLKYAIFNNGPCFGALPVYEVENPEFWKEYGRFNGGHAISIVGYNKDGFIIRNSWGTNWGYDGYTLIKNEDFSSFWELWTVVS